MNRVIESTKRTLPTVGPRGFARPMARLPVPEITTRQRNIPSMPAMTMAWALARRHDLRLGPSQITALPKRGRFVVLSPSSEQGTVLLPWGVPRWITAATLRRLAGVGSRHNLLERVGESWEVVAGDTRIDTKDTSRIFRVAAVAILS